MSRRARGSLSSASASTRRRRDSRDRAAPAAARRGSGTRAAPRRRRREAKCRSCALSCGRGDDGKARLQAFALARPRYAVADFSRALASSHSASISSSVACSGLRPSARQRRLDMAEAALEFGVGAAQRRLRVDLQMAREIDDDEQEIAKLGLGEIGAARRRARPRPRRSPRGFWRAPRARRSSRSRPCRPSPAV